MGKTVRNDIGTSSGEGTFPGPGAGRIWADRFVGQIEKTLRSPSRRNVHSLRRLCRFGMALLLAPRLARDPFRPEMEKLLSGTLRISRTLRNSDVLRRFLARENLSLEGVLSRKEQAKKFRRRLERLWGPDREKLFGREVGRIFRSLLRKDPERERTAEEDLFGTLRELAAFYPLWSTGVERSFEAIHALRIRLKAIDGREKFIEQGIFSGPPLEETRAADLRRILRLLGRMSDLMMLEGMVPCLSGRKGERRRFLKKIRKIKLETDRKIFRFLASEAVRTSSPRPE